MNAVYAVLIHSLRIIVQSAKANQLVNTGNLPLNVQPWERADKLQIYKMCQMSDQ